MFKTFGRFSLPRQKIAYNVPLIGKATEKKLSFCFVG